MIDAETMLGLLRTLHSCGGIPVREHLLYTQYNAAAPGVRTMECLREHLVHARDKGWIDYVVDEIDHAKKWFILEAGKALLAGR
jgi:hypothetical protein